MQRIAFIKTPAYQAGKPVFISGDSKHTLESILAETQKVKATLIENGINPSSRVGIHLGNTPHFIYALLAVADIGASAILFNNRFKQYELEKYCQETQPEIIITSPATTGSIETLASEKQMLASAECPNLAFFKIQYATADHLQPKDPDEFILQFTSGITGESRIVPRTYEEVRKELAALSATLGVITTDTVICPAPMFHSYGLIPGLLTALTNGATFVLMDGFMPNDFLDLVKLHQPTIFIGVPFMYSLLNRTFLEGQTDLSSLRINLSAGAKLSREIAKEFKERYGLKINQLYGSTESGAITINTYQTSGVSSDAVGTALPGKTLQIVNEDDQVLPAGTEGFIRMKSSATMQGYIGQPERSQQILKDGWLYTGDIGKMDNNGNLFITGRKSAFINVAGLKVDPFEVEAAINQHPSITECAVVGIDHPHNGESVKAFIVCEDQISPTDLRRFCKERLAEYKIPQDIAIIDQLPRNPTGKVLKKYLT